MARNTDSSRTGQARPPGASSNTAPRDERPPARNTPSTQPPGDSAGSRAGGALGSASERTGLADGTVRDLAQGLAGAQGSGGGADRRPAGAPLRSPPGGDSPRAEPEGDSAGTPPPYRPDEEAS